MITADRGVFSSMAGEASHANWLPAAQADPEQRFWYEGLVESGFVPDAVIRVAIRRMLRQRLRAEDCGSEEANRAKLLAFVAEMKRSPVAMRAESANAQHYEVPAAFFESVLGPRLKYSSAFYGPDCVSLDQAEEAMLRLTCERAQLTDGQEILELGGGWGSLTLWMAEQYANCRITTVSNSASQRAFIEDRARCRGLQNVRIVTADMNSFDALAISNASRFDRVVSVEMFEHVRNWEVLLQRIACWLKLNGKLFVHIFTHSRFSYPYEVRSAADWMAQHFFTGGMMPGDNLLSHFDGYLRVSEHWRISGKHYQKTAEAWLANMGEHKERLKPFLAATYGAANARKWWARWRIFFLACAELWGCHDGTEWLVSHYLLDHA